MKKRNGSLLFVLGICLVLASLGLLLFLQYQTHHGEKSCRTVVTEMNKRLPAAAPGTPGMYPNPTMPVLEIGGTDYVARLDIPAFGITLPVARNWDANALSPTRYWGSAYDHSLVIGGRDLPWQFGFCDKIDLNASVTVTDMTGARFDYTVARVDRAKEADAQWLMDESFDLTLFCHDLYSMEYIAVRCVFAYH